MKYFIYIVIGVVAAAVVVGVAIVGSPENQRKQRFDTERVSDLQNIQWQLVSYWQRKNALPENLDMLRDDIGGYQVPLDPQTGQPYDYEKTGDRSFKLCATFVGTSAEDGRSSVPPMAYPAKDGLNDFWDHSAGRVCFDRTIDPELYKPYPPAL